MMKVNGRLYPHRYEPLISQELYDLCQDIRLSKNTRKNAVVQTKEDFIFRSILKCAVSGRKVTCDIKKGKYVYLICRDPENPDKKLFIPEKKVLAQIEPIFKALQMPDSLVEALTAYLKNSHEAEKEHHRAAIVGLRRDLDIVVRKKERLLDMRLEGSITKDIYDTKMPLLQQEYVEAKMAVDNYDDADDSYRITVESMFSLASQAYPLFKSSTASIAQTRCSSHANKAITTKNAS